MHFVELSCLFIGLAAFAYQSRLLLFLHTPVALSETNWNRRFLPVSGFCSASVMVEVSYKTDLVFLRAYVSTTGTLHLHCKLRIILIWDISTMSTDSSKRVYLGLVGKGTTTRGSDVEHCKRQGPRRRLHSLCRRVRPNKGRGCPF